MLGILLLEYLFDHRTIMSEKEQRPQESIEEDDEPDEWYAPNPLNIELLAPDNVCIGTKGSSVQDVPVRETPTEVRQLS